MLPIQIAQAGVGGLAAAGLLIMVITALLGILFAVVAVYLTGYIASWGWHDHLDRR